MFLVLCFTPAAAWAGGLAQGGPRFVATPPTHPPPARPPTHHHLSRRPVAWPYPRTGRDEDLVSGPHLQAVAAHRELHAPRHHRHQLVLPTCMGGAGGAAAQWGGRARGGSRHACRQPQGSSACLRGSPVHKVVPFLACPDRKQVGGWAPSPEKHGPPLPPARRCTPVARCSAAQPAPSSQPALAPARTHPAGPQTVHRNIRAAASRAPPPPAAPAWQTCCAALGRRAGLGGGGG